MQFDRDYVFKTAGDKLGNSWRNRKVQDCLALCFDAHAGQIREAANPKSNPVPYILHPLGVAILCVRHFEPELFEDDIDTIVMAALAHDVLEDTDVTATMISKACGSRVAKLVSILTKPTQEPDESNVDRNKRFSQRIVDGGPSSMFIKICDSIHNMSRPQLSPAQLMGKAVSKARKDYSTFFRKGLNHPSLEKAYFDQVQVVTTFLAEARRSTKSTHRSTLTDVLSEAYQAQKKKVLERHDLFGFLETQFSLSFARTVEVGELKDLLLGKEKTSNQQLVRRISNLISAGEIDLSQLPSTARQSALLKDVDRLLLFPMDMLMGRDVSADRLLVLGLRSDFTPNWVTRETVGVVLGFLSKRVRDHERNEYVELSRTAAELGLLVSSDDLADARLSYADVLRLKEALQKAEYFRSIFISELNGRLTELDDVKFPLPIESRTKEPTSVLRKIATRKLGGLGAVDDLAGIRIICVGDADRKSLAELCLNIVGQKFTETINASFPESFSEVTSNSGYRAQHLSFAWNGIGCEIQIRTIFEDTWARVSAALHYKSISRNREVEDALRRLAEFRDQSEIIVKKLR